MQNAETTMTTTKAKPARTPMAMEEPLEVDGVIEGPGPRGPSW